MKKGIYISIKPVHLNRIVTGKKNYEFRNYYPKEHIDVLYVYESSPTCELKYIIELGEIVKYPNKIIKEGYGNDDFNNGLKSSKYAYGIKCLYELEGYISLKELKEKYGFNPPQSYAYDVRYEKLTEDINKMNVKRLI